jgi:deoxyribodipyrimidine photo-lyase
MATEPAAGSDIGVVWFRRDLRLQDNPAWAEATTNHRQVVALFVVEPALMDAAGPHRIRTLLAHLQALDGRLTDLGAGLTVRTGPATAAIPSLLAECGSTDLYLNLDYSRYAGRRDGPILTNSGTTVHGHHGNVIHRPGTILTGQGTLSKVFSAFQRRWAATPTPGWPEAGDSQPITLVSDPLPMVDDDGYHGGEDGAWQRLNSWLDVVDHYEESRHVPSIHGTSELSADLRFGTLAARTVAETVGDGTPGRRAFVRQLAWRDWWAHTLAQSPDLSTRELNPRYRGIEWRHDPDGLEAWQAGRTGYPLVDAGMRQLAATGWMHNRVRMVCASFLVKDLLIDWRLGEAHYRRLLIDGEPGQNGGNWQWVAGTGPDAAPYFRIFNPVTQSKRFDPSGDYIRRWVPELSELDDKAIHQPWASGPLELAADGVVLGDSYPLPMVDHGQARERTIETYRSALQAGQSSG